MKKQGLALILSAAVLVSLLPQNAYATTEVGTYAGESSAVSAESQISSDTEIVSDDALIQDPTVTETKDVPGAEPRDVQSEAEVSEPLITETPDQNDVTPTETPAETQTAEPTVVPDEPTAVPTETPAETPAETPTETPTETPDPMQTPGEVSADDPLAATDVTPVPTETPAVLPEEGILAEEAVEPLKYADIPDGYYTFALRANESRVITIKGYSRENNANAMVYNNTRNAAQIFRIEGKTETVGGVKRKYYVIHSYANDNEVLDVENTRNADNTNVQQYKNHNARAQRWYIVEDKKAGYYTIRSAVSGAQPTRVLDAVSSKNGANLRINTYTGKNFQLFKLTKVTPYEPDEGMYTIHINGTKKVMDLYTNCGDNGTNIDAYVINNSSAQQFYLKSLGYGGYYKIISASSRNAVDVDRGKNTAGTNVHTWAENSNNSQIFRFESTGKNSNGEPVIKILNRNGGVLGVTSGNVQIAGSKQEWYLKKVSDADAAKAISTGFYYLVPKQDTKKAVNITGGSMDDGARAQIAGKKAVNETRFRLTYTSDGYIKLQNLKSGKMLSVANGEMSNATQVRQWYNSDSYAIKWKIVPTSDGDGSIYLQFYDSAFNLNIAGSDAEVGAKMELRRAANASSQKFYLMKTTTSTGWQTYMGLERKLYDGNGRYYKNTTVDGKKLGNDGAPTETWIFVNGFWRYRINGQYVNDARPYLHTLYPMTTKYSGYSEPDVPGYYATLDRRKSLVTIFTKYPGSDNYNLPVCAFKCSPGTDATPTDAGIRYTISRNRWSELMGPSYAQYTTRLSIPGTHRDSGELFHSIPCNSANDHNVPINMYNALGTKQSHGCVRLCVRNSYWIYRFCWLNMTVNVGDLMNNPIRAVPQPKMSGGNVDPTDPAYTGNYGYCDTNVYYGRYYF